MDAPFFDMCIVLRICCVISAIRDFEAEGRAEYNTVSNALLSIQRVLSQACLPPNNAHINIHVIVCLG